MRQKNPAPHFLLQGILKNSALDCIFLACEACCNSCNLYLVGGLEHQFYFPINIGNLIIPIDFHIFQKGGPATNQFCLEEYHVISP